MSFQFDTTGMIDTHPDEEQDRGHLISWPALTPFTQGYVEALFEQAFGDYRDCGWPVPSFSDMAPETFARIIADCEQAQTHRQHQAGFTSAEQHGRFFWADRQRDCQAGFPPLTVYLGDDGKVRFQ